MVTVSTVGFTPGVPSALNPSLMNFLFTAPVPQAETGSRLGQLVCAMALAGMNPVCPERAHLTDEYLRPITEITPHVPEIKTSGGCVHSIAGPSTEEVFPSPHPKIAGKAQRGDPDAKLYLKAWKICDLLGGEAIFFPWGRGRPLRSPRDSAVAHLNGLARELNPKDHRMALAHVLGRIGDLKSSPSYHKRAAKLWLPEDRDGKARKARVEYESLLDSTLTRAEQNFMRRQVRRQGEYAAMSADAVLSIIQNAAFDVWQTQNRKFIHRHLGNLAGDLFWHSYSSWLGIIISDASRSGEPACESTMLATLGRVFVTSANLFVASAVVAFGLGRFEDTPLAGAGLSWRIASGVFECLSKDTSLCGHDREGVSSASKAVAAVVEKLDRLWPPAGSPAARPRRPRVKVV